MGFKSTVYMERFVAGSFRCLFFTGTVINTNADPTALIATKVKILYSDLCIWRGVLYTMAVFRK